MISLRGPRETGNTDRRITRVERARHLGHRSGIFWLTGLSGAGKSTLANDAEALPFRKGYSAYLLDGDAIRAGISADLGFSPRSD